MQNVSGIWTAVVLALTLAGTSACDKKDGAAGAGSGGKTATAKQPATMEQACDHACNCMTKPQGKSPRSAGITKEECMSFCLDSDDKRSGYRSPGREKRKQPPQACIDCMVNVKCDEFIEGKACRAECPDESERSGS